MTEEHRKEAAFILLVAGLVCLAAALSITVGIFHHGDSRAWAQGGLLLGFSSLLFRP